jgi:hypothetical protein
VDALPLAFPPEREQPAMVITVTAVIAATPEARMNRRSIMIVSIPLCYQP